MGHHSVRQPCRSAEGTGTQHDTQEQESVLLNVK